MLLVPQGAWYIADPPQRLGGSGGGGAAIRALNKLPVPRKWCCRWAHGHSLRVPSLSLEASRMGCRLRRWNVGGEAESLGLPHALACPRCSAAGP